MSDPMKDVMPMTREELVALPLTFVSNFTFEDGTQRTSRNEQHGITMIVRTFTRRGAGLGAGRRWKPDEKAFYLDGSKKAFATTDELLLAVNKRGKA